MSWSTWSQIKGINTWNYHRKTVLDVDWICVGCLNSGVASVKVEEILWILLRKSVETCWTTRKVMKVEALRTFTPIATVHL